MKTVFAQMAVAIAIIGSSFAAERPAASASFLPAAASALSGRWRSFELGGSEIGSDIRSVSYTFSANGRFSASAVLSDGKQQAYKGVYVVHESSLALTVAEKGTEKLSYSLQGDVLTIRDPKLDSYIKFKKVP